MNMHTTDQDLVTIASFRDYVQAHIAKSKLESEGFDCWIADDVVVTLNWFQSQFLGGVKLKVRENDAKGARAALAGPPVAASVSRISKVIFVVMIIGYVFPIAAGFLDYLSGVLTGGP